MLAIFEMRRAVAPALLLAVATFVMACGKAGRTRVQVSEPEIPVDRGSGPQCEEGTLRDCSQVAGSDGAKVTCRIGSQECRDGSWGPCGERGIAFITRQLGASSAQSSACKDNPCTADCLGFDADQPVPIENPSGDGFTFEGNPNEWGNAPGGFEGKQDCGRAEGGCLDGYPKKCNGDPIPYNRFDGCQAEHHCDDATNECVRNEPGWTFPSSVCPGVDLSVGPACYNGQNHGFPVCNRGNTALAAGTPIKIAITNGNAYDLSCPKITNGTICTIQPTEPLLPGDCLRVANGGSCTWNGNAVAYVNADLSIPECGMPLPSPPTSATQPGCSNNWSDVKTGASCEVFAEGAYEVLDWEEDYTATCPVGTRPLWDLLAFEAVTSCSPGACDGTNASSVKFEVQTAPKESPTQFTDWSLAAQAPNPPFSHPASCTATGPSPSCPVKLSEIVNPMQEHLRLRITLLPSPDRKAAAALSRWQVTYVCGALE